ncbi:hypothetical protein SDC9_183483 [bioreactor metagenome]|uniref:Uncharacterized protein n=1 Tax=bioreactor metagenome TaxID=1076179 RepID=A0A645HAC5_9ZZZZ
MSDITEILERANFQQIRAFLLGGQECANVDNRSYQKRIRDIEKTTLSMISEKFSDLNECEVFEKIFFNYTDILKNVYMELGLQCGIKLTMQLIKELPKE